MKYIKLIKDGKEMKTVIAVAEEKLENAKASLEKAGYVVQECERPENPIILTSEAIPSIKPNFPKFEGEKSIAWKGPNCSRCKNRYNHKSQWCNDNHKKAKCYKFKLEKYS